MDNEFVKFRIAVATSDGIVVNQHFGKADTFRIYDINQDNTIDFKEERAVDPVCQGGVHDDMKMKESVSCLIDCKYVLASRIGQGAINALEQVGINPMELPGIIEESIRRLVAYDEVQALLA
ncbi:MAG: dinitrogenase iron-molybdenum cofactor biosynthesis protein [Lachnospiraceae bacterium]|nr:dinitrogenase iron-molybdenum cofactor biosynthesis protein [Lachnospiraceae bacterium]